MLCLLLLGGLKARWLCKIFPLNEAGLLALEMGGKDYQEGKEDFLLLQEG